MIRTRSQFFSIFLTLFTIIETKAFQSPSSLFRDNHKYRVPSQHSSREGCKLYEANDDPPSGSDLLEDTPLTLSNWTCPSEDMPPLTAGTLDSRLLCAAQCAYEIAPPYFQSAAFIAGSTVKRITRGVNSVLVGRTADGIVISFRGTVSTSPLDWLQNAALFLSNPGDGIKGKIHIGFYSAVKALWEPTKAAIRDMLKLSDKGILLTGHSKGGALASIAAILMQRDAELPDPYYVCTFASPKFADTEFAKAYNEEIKQTSFEAYLDLIPFLPPSQAMMDSMGEEMSGMINEIMWSEKELSEGYIWDYQSVGARRYINKANSIVFPVTNDVDDARIREIEQETFLSLRRFRAAHCSACPGENCDGRYFLGVAGFVCNSCKTYMIKAPP